MRQLGPIVFVVLVDLNFAKARSHFMSTVSMNNEWIVVAVYSFLQDTDPSARFLRSNRSMTIWLETCQSSARTVRKLMKSDIGRKQHLAPILYWIDFQLLFTQWTTWSWSIITSRLDQLSWWISSKWVLKKSKSFPRFLLRLLRSLNSTLVSFLLRYRWEFNIR